MESGEARKLLLVSPPRSGFISIGRPEVATGIDNFAAKILEKLGLTMTAIGSFLSDVYCKGLPLVICLLHRQTFVS
jgi:hypothetical protein